MRDSGIKRGHGLKKKKTKEDINLLFVTKDNFGTKQEDGKRHKAKSRKKNESEFRDGFNRESRDGISD